MKKFLKIAIPLVITVVLSYLFIEFGKVDYDLINQPKFAPPSFVFSIAWSIIYVLMFITVYKLYHIKSIYRSYLAILLSHIIWNLFYFFFGFLILGCIILSVIFLMSWIFVYQVYQENKKLSYLNIPYILWLILALYLNIGTAILN